MKFRNEHWKSSDAIPYLYIDLNNINQAHIDLKKNTVRNRGTFISMAEQDLKRW